MDLDAIRTGDSSVCCARSVGPPARTVEVAGLVALVRGVGHDTPWRRHWSRPPDRSMVTSGSRVWTSQQS